MGWRNDKQLTTASNIQRLSFNGRGSIFPVGTFGGGTVQIKPVAENTDENTKTVALGSAFDINGSTVKTADVPSGLYELELNGSAAGDVTIFYNDQSEGVVTQ